MGLRLRPYESARTGCVSRVYGVGPVKSGTKRRLASDRRMRASLALTALAMEPCSRAVLNFFPELKRPLLRPTVAKNVSCCCGMDTAGGMDTWMDGFRHERAWLQRSSRHALTAPRCASAPEPHVCSLCRCSVDS